MYGCGVLTGCDLELAMVLVGNPSGKASPSVMMMMKCCRIGVRPEGKGDNELEERNLLLARQDDRLLELDLPCLHIGDEIWRYRSSRYTWLL